MGDLTVRVRLVRTPEGQRLDIPPGFMLGGDEAILRTEGDRLVVEPVAARSLLAVLGSLEHLDEDWPEIADPQPDDVRL
ncbi:AbrB/MazE/SpoVT family DNA-binding domain-containing protein [Methylobacterium sp. Leaf118]|uniref:AbrB/MazE/SpoVT family DNA-binding domain-containing protein n=1 Tax=Methylobacterium sp. Leaf118 TaxID=2876562 RepID=UPI001E62339C|nr:AbrB/MazE/SpoVT family DNA-binding domain-containing protein [Methylobacterium sp. Leaf118]